MSSIVRAARVLLEEFARSDWRDVHVRTREGTIFIAKADGAENPLRADADEGIIRAPHVATVVRTQDLDSRVGEGDVVVTLAVLGENLEIASPRNGQVSVVFVRAGELVEYGAPLVRVV